MSERHLLGRLGLLVTSGLLLLGFLFNGSTLQSVIPAEGKVNAPLDIALDSSGQTAYLLEADGDLLRVHLSEDWARASLEPVSGLKFTQPTGLTLLEGDQALLVADGLHLATVDPITGQEQRIGPDFPEPVSDVARGRSRGKAFVATQAGGLYEITLSNARNLLGQVDAEPHGLVYDSARDRLYVATQQGIILSVNPTTGASERLAFVGPVLGKLFLDGNRLYVTAAGVGQYLLDLDAGAAPHLFFPEVAGPTAIVEKNGRVLLTTLGDGLVLLSAINFIGPQVTKPTILIPPALGPVRSLAIDRRRHIAFSTDDAGVLFSLDLSKSAIASFVYTPFVGRVVISPTQSIFYATDRLGNQVLAQRFDPPFVFSTDLPPIPPAVIYGLPEPDGLALDDSERWLYVATLADAGLWRVDLTRYQKERLADLPRGARSIDLRLRGGTLYALLDETSGPQSGMLIAVDLASGAERVLLSNLDGPTSLALLGEMAYLALPSQDGVFVADLRRQALQRLVTLDRPSALVLDDSWLYIGDRKGTLWTLTFAASQP